MNNSEEKAAGELVAYWPEVENKKGNDQRIISVYGDTTVAKREPVTVSLPMFMDTLYKARDFDPL